MGVSETLLPTACFLLAIHVGRLAALDPGPVPVTRSTLHRQNASYYRLPADLVPVSYVIQVAPTLGPGDNPPMRGRVNMTFRVIRPTNRIFLHGLNIEMSEGNIYVKNLSSEEPIPVVNMTYEPDREMFNIELHTRLEEGPHLYSIDIQYVAYLANWMGGFYKASYVVDGQNRYLMASQLQATLARRAFPCMDEPHLKATFQIKVLRQLAYTAISNMPCQSSEPQGGRVLDTFQPTPNMSTYLVVVVVSDLIRREILTSTESPQQAIWGRKDAMERGEYHFAKEEAPRILKALEQWTNISFPLPQLHHIAVPEKEGAMENWGLITYQEDYLLVDDHTSEGARQNVLTVIAHETAHQWFGNLVSPLLWDYTWLSEGFATFMQSFIADKVKPTWQIMELFPEKTQLAMEADVLPGSFPLTQVVGSAEEILAHFGRITYNKGGAIIRMAQHMLGYKVFQAGITNYLKQSPTGTPKALFASWQNAADEANMKIEVEGTLHQYTTKTGYPVITVMRDYSGGVVKVKQRPFPGSPNDTAWNVPLSMAWKKQNQSGSTKPVDWLPPLFGAYVLKQDIPKDAWVVLNFQQTGYYRVNYDDRNWMMLVEELSQESPSIPAQTRSMLLDDAWNLWYAGLLDLKPAFQLTLTLAKDRDLLPWYTAKRHLQRLLRVHMGTRNEDLLKEMVKEILSPWYAYLGFEIRHNDSHVDLLARELVLPWVCTLGHRNCTKKAKAALNKWITSESHDVPEYWETAVWCAASRSASDHEWNFLMTKMQNTSDSKTQRKFLSALSCSPRERLIGLLDLNATRTFSYEETFTAVCNSPDSTGPETAWTFLQDNFDHILQKYGNDTMKNIILGMGNTLITTERRLLEFSRLGQRVDPDSKGLLEAFSTASKTLAQRRELMDRQRTEVGNQLFIRRKPSPAVAPVAWGVPVILVFALASTWWSIW